MIHLRVRILSSLVHSPSRLPASRVSPLLALHRNLSAATTSTPQGPFAAEDYLVATCGVTRAQALKASNKISHLKSSSKPDAVLAFLSGLGVPRSDVATLVAVDPRFLCASVERTLAPRVTELRELGLSRSQIARLVPLALCSFRSSSLSRNLDFWLSVFGSYDKLLKALRMNSGLLAADLDKVAKPNLALLQQCGLSPSLFSEPFISRVLIRTPQQVQDALVNIDKFGVSQNSRMFLYALVAFTVQSPEKLTDKIQVLETLGWSKGDVLLAVKKMPGILTVSEERLQRNMHFLTKVAGLEISYIAQRPVLLKYSLERRLFPRYCLLKLLNTKGLLDLRFDYHAASLSETKFLAKFVHPYKESLPGLADVYASSCAEKMPSALLSKKENYRMCLAWSWVSAKGLPCWMKDIKPPHARLILRISMAAMRGMLFAVLCGLLMHAACMAEAQTLKLGYYDQTCPSAESIVLDVVRNASKYDPTTPAALLRLHFHDCFVNGCDASVLLEDPNKQAEKNAAPNGSLRGYEVIDKIKARIEAACKQTVSCADILAYAARDSVRVATGWYSYKVPGGRQDGTESKATLALSNLPPSNQRNFDLLAVSFTRKGLTVDDLIVLSGAHTLGVARCGTFGYRLMNQDKGMNSTFRNDLIKKCNFNGKNEVPLDAGSPYGFDTSYYANVLANKTVLDSDAALNSPSTVRRVRELKDYPSTFMGSFVTSMGKMGSLRGDPSKLGKVRDNCRRVRL